MSLIYLSIEFKILVKIHRPSKTCQQSKSLRERHITRYLGGLLPSNFLAHNLCSPPSPAGSFWHIPVLTPPLIKAQVHCSDGDTKWQWLKQNRNSFFFHISLYINTLGFEWFPQNDRHPSTFYLIPLLHAVCFPIHVAQDVSSLGLHCRQWEGERGREGIPPFKIIIWKLHL